MCKNRHVPDILGHVPDILDALAFRLSDADAMKKIKKISKCDNASEFQLLSQTKRNEYIKQLKNNGLSIRQISRLTGVSKGIVERTQ